MDDQHPSARPPSHETDDPTGDPTWDAVARHLAGEADASTDAAARAWLANHPDDAAAVASLDARLARLAFTPPPGLDVEGALQRVKARRAAEAARPAEAPRVLPLRAPAPRPRALPAPWKIAAAVLVLLGGPLLWQATRAPTSGGAPHLYLTLVGARDSVRLADGTRVILGGASRLEVPADYGEARRDVRLRGEAYFEVRHDDARPFTVHTAAGSVRDVGTAFVVRDGSDGRVTVAVTEGVVVLHRPGAASDTATAAQAGGVVLRAGDRGTLVPGRAASATRGAQTDADVAWTRGQLVFEDAAFPDVAAEVRRWYGIALVAADSATARRHLTASFGAESPDEVLRVIGLALGASVERRGDTAYVRPSR